jgi:hypothetical protein
MSDLWGWRNDVFVVAVPRVDLTVKPADELPKQERTDVTGFDVEARDGHLGKIDGATYDPGTSGVVVDTGFWIFGKKRILPAGLVERIDPEQKKVYVACSKADIKNAPDYDARADSPAPRNEIVDYYRQK